MSQFDLILYRLEILRHRNRKEKTMENKMGHFIDWKFGVPVRVIFSSGKSNSRGRLFYEDDSLFRVITDDGVYGWFYKTQTRYELIPYQYGDLVRNHVNRPRFPVCESPDYVAFCNSGNGMTILDAGDSKKYEFLPIPSVATLNIDGKTIELSAETTAELKKKLGV